MFLHPLLFSLFLFIKFILSKLEHNSSENYAAALYYHQKGQSMEEISKALGISFRAIARAIASPTHFLSVYDLQDPNDDGDFMSGLPRTTFQALRRML